MSINLLNMTQIIKMQSIAQQLIGKTKLLKICPITELVDRMPIAQDKKN